MHTMAPRRVVAAVCVSAALLGASAGTAGEADVPAGTGVVFTVFEELPPNGACPGLYAVDARTREITWIGGLDLQQGTSHATYPAFTAGGTFSYAIFTDSGGYFAVANIYAGRRVVARGIGVPPWAWSPRREEVVFGRLVGGRPELALASVTGSTRVLARGASYGLSWLPNGAGLVYGPPAGSSEAIGFVRRDGRGRRVLARNASFPLVSPDGRRVAFLRSRARVARGELWVVPTSGGPARKILGPAPAEKLRPVVWLSNRELLVQHGGARDSIFDVSDTVTRVNVDTGRERPFLKSAFALQLSPDRSRVLFVRPHRGGETYYSIRTVRVDGSDAQILGVTDEEDLNSGSRPVWKPASARVEPFGDPLPAGITPEACAARLTAARARTP
jgi:hypothetical protein